MIEALVWLAVLVLAAAGLAALGRKRPITAEEYRRRRGKGAGLGNALLALHDLLEPQRGQAGKARLERRAEVDPEGDPPDPGGNGGSPPEGRRP